jgi:hypothetical protein
LEIVVIAAMAYMDESGDLGWKLDEPYLDGGSSRFFVIAIAIGMNQGFRRFGKVVDRLHKMQKWTSSKEKKWKTISAQARLNFCQLAAAELASNPDMRVLVAVCHKEHAPDFMQSVDVRTLHPGASESEILRLESRYRGRAHLVYSMMVAETLGEHLPPVDSFSYCPDDLNESVRTLEHIVTYRLLFQDERAMSLNRVDYKRPMQSGLDFADMIAGAVWESFERSDGQYHEILRNHITIKEFYDPQAC